ADHDGALHVDGGHRAPDGLHRAPVGGDLVAPALERSGRQGAGLGDAQELEREVAICARFDHGFPTLEYGIAAGSLADAPAPDRQLSRLHPEILLAGKPTIAISIHINARALQDGRDAHDHTLERGGETVDQDLVLVELDLAEAPWTRRADLVGQDQLSPRGARRPGLDRQPRTPAA